MSQAPSAADLQPTTLLSTHGPPRHVSQSDTVARGIVHSSIAVVDSSLAGQQLFVIVTFCEQILDARTEVHFQNEVINHLQRGAGLQAFSVKCLHWWGLEIASNTKHKLCSYAFSGVPYLQRCRHMIKGSVAQCREAGKSPSTCLVYIIVCNTIADVTQITLFGTFISGWLWTLTCVKVHKLNTNDVNCVLPTIIQSVTQLRQMKDV